eukprot:CAMPEP_0184692932 /NCGR_PEP_ID=MMETSP0313-20130426/1250_1 /TAXON_ID=2792 /ORGANISM="Porphyridium aerugineum, Strain SAG 1380-2" /LENGTH=282 /DNA_ID=CAMNT_0027150849 /DNA_START=159 /DNA_END=1007 /DNA_ORIENTATION=+
MPPPPAPPAPSFLVSTQDFSGSVPPPPPPPPGFFATSGEFSPNMPMTPPSGAVPHQMISRDEESDIPALPTNAPKVTPSGMVFALPDYLNTSNTDIPTQEESHDDAVNGMDANREDLKPSGTKIQDRTASGKAKVDANGNVQRTNSKSKSAGANAPGSTGRQGSAPKATQQGSATADDIQAPPPRQASAPKATRQGSAPTATKQPSAPGRQASAPRAPPAAPAPLPGAKKKSGMCSCFGGGKKKAAPAPAPAPPPRPAAPPAATTFAVPKGYTRYRENGAPA